MSKLIAWRIGTTMTFLFLPLTFTPFEYTWLIGLPALALVLYGYDH